MGLDNGIDIKGLKIKDIKNIPWYVELRDCFGPQFNVTEVCYWRKCWGLRSDIMGVLHMYNDEYSHPVEEDDIPAIIRVIERYLDKEVWEDEGDSIWTYEEAKGNLLQCIKNLCWLKEYMHENKHVKCEFYDSY